MGSEQIGEGTSEEFANSVGKGKWSTIGYICEGLFFLE